VIDSHCHLDLTAFDGDRSEALVRAWGRGVEGVLIPALGPASWDGLLVWPKTDPRIQVALGIHPWLLHEWPASEDGHHLERLDELLGLGVACAVGDCGLDRSGALLAPLDRQVKVLDGHLRLARKHRLPLILHCRRAHAALEVWMRRVRLPEAGAVLHDYTGGPERVGGYSARGCWFSFAGSLTWPEARRRVDSLRVVRHDRLLVETCAPKHAPVPHRGQRSEPSFVLHVAEAMARQRSEAPGELASRLSENARRFFARPFRADAVAPPKLTPPT
jgi:TatD DNase family protein